MQVLGMSEEEQFWFTMYGVFGLLTTGAYILSSSVFMLSAVAASRNFHNRIFNSVLRGSVNLFFDVQVRRQSAGPLVYLWGSLLVAGATITVPIFDDDVCTAPRPYFEQV